MNEIKQRIAIAEACGLEPIKRFTRKNNPAKDGVVLKYKACEGGGWYSWELVPNFTKDLNACHKMEAYLGDLSEKYVTLLVDRLGDRWGFATAKQRCEAFLRTLGKWEEE